MVGVTSPLFRNGNARDGVALLGWYIVGTALAGLVVFTGLSVLSVGASSLLPTGSRYLILALCVAVLLAFDVLGKTPHLNRQTAQRLVDLPASVRGFVWGLDIGLLFTTIKVTSLVWLLLVVSIVDPSHALLGLGIFYAAYLSTEGIAVAADFRWGSARVFSRLQGVRFLQAARMVSVTFLGLVLASAVNRIV